MMLNPQELEFLACFAAALLVLGGALALAAGKGRREDDGSSALAQQLEHALPGVQCGQCGFAGCQGYARAMAAGDAPCNKCPPGGPDTVSALAEILGIDPPADEAGDDALFYPRTVAYIHGIDCTGCTKCTRKCPVDAIVGKIKEPHRVLSYYCTGCGECVKICPAECIELQREKQTLSHFNWEIRSVAVNPRNS